MQFNFPMYLDKIGHNLEKIIPKMHFDKYSNLNLSKCTKLHIILILSLPTLN